MLYNKVCIVMHYNKVNFFYIKSHLTVSIYICIYVYEHTGNYTRLQLLTKYLAYLYWTLFMYMYMYGI